MSVSYTYPGVYIQELPSPVHTITGVATSIAAFVGYTPRGIDNRAQVIFSFADFERLYGGLGLNSEVSYAVQQFYQNAPGAQAYVVRVPMVGATAAKATVDDMTFSALSSGSWANGQLLIDVDVQNLDLAADSLAFNLTITDIPDNTTESFPNVTLDANAMNYVTNVINDPDNGSQLVNVSVAGTPAGAPAVTGIVGEAITTTAVNTAVGGGSAATTATQDFSFQLSTSSPAAVAPLPVTVKVIGNGTPIPQSMAGLAAQLQQAINAVLAVQMPGASVQCSVSQLGGGDQAIRVNALLPQQPDAVLSFAAPGAGGDASAALGLSAPTTANVAHYALGTGHTYAPGIAGGETASVAGANGTGLPQSAGLIGDPAQFTGIYALQKVGLFNLLSIPDATRASAGNPAALDNNVDPNAVYSAAISLCQRRRAMLLVDAPPPVNTVSAAVDWKTSGLGVHQENGAAYFPRLRLPDPLNSFQPRTFAPSGVVAGLYARIDASRGVWKAPAGTEATLTGVQSMAYKLNDLENGVLNPLGLNCARIFPIYGPVMWGARTLVGSDAEGSQWKYVPIRRLALFIEESLYRGTKWAVFEPNDETLWAQLRLNIGVFMHDLFRRGAFQGQSPRDAYLVKCDKDTTTQSDIDRGIVNILVGFAPLKPAEFVIIQIQQLAGQLQT